MKKTSTKAARGMLVVFEGLDGAGKSTQIKHVRARLREEGRTVTTVSWNSSGIVGTHMQELAQKRAALSRHGYAALMAADLADQLQKKILPALKRGHVVLCDRYAYTQIARDEALGLDPAWTERLFAWVPQPDLVVYLDLPSERSFERVRERVMRAPRARRDDPGLDGTMQLALQSDYQADGEPMTELARRRELREVQARVAVSYARQGAQHGFVSVDATMKPAQVRDEIVAHVLRSIPA